MKGTDKQWQEGSEEVYNYLLCAVGPLEGEYEPGLPEAGFLYPAFRQRSTACDYINLYEKIKIWDICGKSYEKILRKTGEWTYVKKFDEKVP